MAGGRSDVAQRRAGGDRVDGGVKLVLDHGVDRRGWADEGGLSSAHKSYGR